VKIENNLLPIKASQGEYFSEIMNGLQACLASLMHTVLIKFGMDDPLDN